MMVLLTLRTLDFYFFRYRNIAKASGMPTIAADVNIVWSVCLSVCAGQTIGEHLCVSFTGSF